MERFSFFPWAALGAGVEGLDRLATGSGSTDGGGAAGADDSGSANYIGTSNLISRNLSNLQAHFRRD